MFMHLTRRVLTTAGIASLLLLAAGTGLARAGRKHGDMPPASSSRNASIWRVSTAAPDVAITFDDGPDPMFTPRMLAVLNRFGAVGTFFVLGMQVARYPGVIRQEATQGSEVCNHGYSHRILRGRADAFVSGDVRHTQIMLDGLGVPRCRLFRFPYLASDAASRSVVTHLGYRIIAANVDTQDWRQPNPEKMAAHVLGRLRAGDIILLHDGGGVRARTVQALGLILRGMAQRGLHAVTVSQLLATVPHGRPPAAGEE